MANSQWLESGSGDPLFDRLLHESSSVFGRLVRGATLSPASGEDQTEAAGFLQCQTAHLRIFRLWLDLPLREQRADLRRYLCGADAAGQLPEARRHCDSPAALVPELANSHERELFLRDLRLVSVSMANDGCALDLPAPARGAWAALWHWKPKWRTTGQPVQ